MKPYTPEDAKENVTLPDYVIKVINTLLAENYNDNMITILQADIVNRLLECPEVTDKATIFNRNYLNIESIYRNNGWIVTYETPGYRENFPSHFTFKPKK